MNFIILKEAPWVYLCLPRNPLGMLKLTEIFKGTLILPTTRQEKSGRMSYCGEERVGQVSR